MSSDVLVLVLASLLAVPVVWMLPAARSQDGVAGLTLIVLAWLSPGSALWLGAAALVTPGLMRLGDAVGRRGLVVTFWGGGLVATLGVSRLWPEPHWIGGAYFTLRHLHVLFEWWMGRLGNPGVARHMRYQLFLPVLAIGPIHRLPHFERQLARRRWEAAAFFTGAERALFGAASAIVMGEWLMGRVLRWATARTGAWNAFGREWVLSALEWVQLYLTFAGLTGLALGLSLMMGLRLEENFDRPWKSRNLIEFWSRWHITLSQWCRDYVFQPVTALTRSPLLGLAAAMTAIAVWHEVSAYYLLWAGWQVLGIVLTRLAQRLRWPTLPSTIVTLLGPVLVLGWLSLARPVLTFILKAASP